MVSERGALRVGTSGWQYDHWKGIFYPPGLAKSGWFRHYAEHFDTVEVNNTFYNLPEEATFAAWRERAPDRFLYALKLSRYGSHRKKLKDPAEWLDRFIVRAERLEQTLGPLLVQLPPKWRLDAERLSEFLAAAPERLRWVVEFRDASWLCEEVFALLRAHNAALCVHDLIADHPWVRTADFVYLRYHGAGQPYGGNYAEERLRADAARLRALLAQGIDVFAYFNNDAHGYAVANAHDLRRYAEN